MCFGIGQTWYLSAEFAMFFLSPLVIWPMFKYRGSKGALLIWTGTWLVSVLVPFSLTLAYNLPPLGVT